MLKNHPSIDASLLYGIQKHLGINNLNDLQQKCFKEIISNKNLAIIAATGRGKTLAYLIPIAELCIKIQKVSLIVLPSSELAYQVFSVAKTMLQSLDNRVLIELVSETTQPKTNPGIIYIGSLEKCTTYTRKHKIQHLDILVFDDCDVLIGLEQNKSILSLIQESSTLKKAQLVMVSATLNEKHTICQIMNKPTIVQDLQIQNDQIQHFYAIAQNNEKFQLLYGISRIFGSAERILIFSNSVHELVYSQLL